VQSIKTSKLMKSFLKILSVFALTALLFSSCKKDEFYLQNTPELSVSINAANVAQGGGIVTIDVQSTRRWHIRTESDQVGWFEITPFALMGEDDGQITVTVFEENEWLDRDLVLYVETAGGLLQRIVISQEGDPTAEILLFETFGPGAAANTPVGEYNGFIQEGVGAGAVTFVQGQNSGLVDVRTTMQSPVPAFSGGANVLFNAGAGGTLLVNNIALHGANRVQISFATNQTNEVMSLEYSTDSITWRTLDFTKTTAEWGRVTVETRTVEGAETLYLKIVATAVSFGARIDDIRVVGVGVEVPPTEIFEDFETMIGDEISGTYAGFVRTFASGNWFIRGLTRGGPVGTPSVDANDRVHGQRSIRLRGNASDEAAGGNYVEMRFNKLNGIGTVSFYYGSFGTHSGGILRVMVSSDNGATWTQYGEDVIAPSWAAAGQQLRMASVEVNRTGDNNRVRILKPVQPGSTSVNVDNIRITDFTE